MGQPLLICFECKFTESGGACSQTKPLKEGPQQGVVQCDGKYHLQTNPVNRISSNCALTGKGILYWDAIPQVFSLSPQMEYAPCPFAGSYFQWMRNLTLCFGRAKNTVRRPAVIVVYADHPDLDMSRTLATSRWRAFAETVRGEAITFSAMSYQTIISVAEAAVAGLPEELTTWRELRRWVEQKIISLVGGRD